MGTQRIDIIINGKNSLSSALKSAAGDVKKLGTDAKTASTGLGQMGTKGQEASNKLKTGLGSVKSLVNDLKTGFSSLGGVMTSVLAGFTFADMVKSAGDAESKWLRISVNTGITGQNLINLKSTVRDIANHYGVLNSEVSGIYEKAVRFYGSSDEALQKVKGIVATSKLTPGDVGVDEVYNAVISGELKRNRALQKNVLTEAQRNKYLNDGVLTDEEINQILQENTELVEKHPELVNDANSAYARMENAVSKIKVSLGKGLLPVMEKLAEIITWAADKFSWLDKQTGGWLSTITAVGIALVALGAPLALVWGAVSKILGGFKDIVGKVKDFVLPSTKKVKIDCEQDDDCDCSGTGRGGKRSPSSSGTGAGVGLAGMVLTAKQLAAPILAPMLLGGVIGQKGLATISPYLNQAGAWLTGTTPEQGQAARDAAYKKAGQNPNTSPIVWDEIGKWVGGQDILSLLGLPGAASAAGTGFYSGNPNDPNNFGPGGKSSITQDIFGKNGLLDFSRFIPDFKWPNVGQVLGGILDWVKSKVPNLKWPSVGQIFNSTIAWIKTKIPKLSWPNISWDSIAGWVKSKIGWLHFPSISWGSIARWIQDNIGKLQFPSPSQVAGWVRQFIFGGGGGSTGGGLRAHGPRGPASSFISSASGGFQYRGYAGNQQSISETIGCMTGNCVDGTFAQMAIAESFGIPSEMVFSSWNGNPHVYARIGGRTRDIANHALTGSWNAPPRGPSGPGGGNVIIYGDVYGFDDFKRKVEMANNQLVRW